jgi:phosphotransferase system enzyme I (PtsP)
MTATDRGNGTVESRIDPLSAPFLRALKSVLDAGRRAGTPVTLCGELASRPISAMALIGLGFRSISMSAAAIGPVKAMLVDLPVEALTAQMGLILGDGGASQDARAFLRAFAADHEIPL